MASWTLAVDREYHKGEDRRADFIDCVGWNDTGEFVSRNFRKGKMMALVGRLQIRDWTDKEGNKRRSAEVVARDIFFCGDKGNDTSSVKGTPAQFASLDEDDGEFPFD